MTSMTSQAAYMALRKDADDDSTLAGSRLIGSDDRSMEYSSIGESVSGASSCCSNDEDGIISVTSSLFQNDRYFQEPLEDHLPRADWSQYHGERGRQFAKTMLKKHSNKKRTKKRNGGQGLLQRAVRAFRRRKQAKPDTLLLGPCSTSDDDFSDGEITFDQASSTEDPWQAGEASLAISVNDHQEPPPQELDCISDCTSDATYENTSGVEVWLPSDSSTSLLEDESDDDDMLPTSPVETSLHVQLSILRNRRDSDAFCPDGLLIRTSAQQVVDQLQLGDAGQTALRALDEATEAAATKACDPPKTKTSADATSTVIPTLVTIAGYAVPDYTTYVRSAVSSFGKNVLQLSDELYNLLEKRMIADNLEASKLRLLPFAVELYALERLMANPLQDEGSV